MTKLPLLSAREVISRLRRLCFKEERQSGSHLILKRVTGETVVIPVHGDRELRKNVMLRIINVLEDRFGYSRKEAIEFLRTGKPEKVNCPIDR